MISFVYNWSTIYTIQDRNLGATCSDPTQSCSYWLYYQWWNIYWFNSSLSYTKNTTNPDLSWYWPWNLFNSNWIFYTKFSSSNWNLWWWTSNSLSDKQWPCSSWFYITSSWSSFLTDLHNKYWFYFWNNSSSSFTNYLLMPYNWLIWWSFSKEWIWSRWFYWENRSASDSDWYRMWFDPSDWWYNYQNNKQYALWVRCFKIDVVDPDCSWSVLFGDSISCPTPKFKVNYSNTSYEYELEDNLEIHLKSPVIMSWIYNYIYDWPTWINLFYNNTSDFYNKDKLYLKSMYWYNKNIFTPICL